MQSTKQWTEPKALRKARKRREKAEKLAAAEPKKETVVASNKRYVCCLKHGTKYTADYVNRLKNMVDRNITVPYEFICSGSIPMHPIRRDFSVMRKRG